MSLSLWKKCLIQLQKDLSDTEFNIFIHPLQDELIDNILILYAPNIFVLNLICKKYLNKIKKLLSKFSKYEVPILSMKVGIKSFNTKIIYQKNKFPNRKINSETEILFFQKNIKKKLTLENFSFQSKCLDFYQYSIHPKYNFDNFIEGQSNKLARMAAKKIIDVNIGIYNPLFLYGGSGLGKTHLLHAVGNDLIAHKSNTKVIYMNSESFIQNMVKALQENTITDFKNYYRSANTLLIDDIQFFANKEHSQEEFLHTFNALLDNNQKIVLTADCYPKCINGVADRLRSRFDCGLSVAINPPELETRVKILIKKAYERNAYLSNDTAFFLAKKLSSNVRELEGALNCIVSNINFTGHEITIDFAQEVLHDLFYLQTKLFTIKYIQKIVSEYFKIKKEALYSKNRLSSIIYPRQIAIALSKKFTNFSLTEIGREFGRRSHTTVLYAIRKIEQLCKENNNIKEDFSNLTTLLFSQK